jgi:hypothetical protein
MDLSKHVPWLLEQAGEEQNESKLDIVRNGIEQVLLVAEQPAKGMLQQILKEIR